jgi:hypothetical protein
MLALANDFARMAIKHQFESCNHLRNLRKFCDWLRFFSVFSFRKLFSSSPWDILSPIIPATYNPRAVHSCANFAIGFVFFFSIFLCREIKNFLESPRFRESKICAIPWDSASWKFSSSPRSRELISAIPCDSASWNMSSNPCDFAIPWDPASSFPGAPEIPRAYFLDWNPWDILSHERDFFRFLFNLKISFLYRGQKKWKLRPKDELFL